jgi:hypothetical protein
MSKPNCKKINKWLRKEFRAIKKKKKQCKKLYPDWKDDEFNMLEDKFIWGVLINPYENVTPSFNTLNKAYIYYNRETKLYYLNIDLYPVAKGSKGLQLTYLKDIKTALLNYVFATDDDGIVPHGPVSVESIAMNGIMGETIEDLYLQFLILYYGFEKYID